MEIFKTTITSQRKISRDYYEMNFYWPEVYKQPQPGQYFTIRVEDGISPLLRRPFAFSGYNKTDREASFIYQTRGLSTQLLTEKQEGDFIDIMAPLGNHFVDTDKPIFSLAGGIGTGPMVYWSNYLASKGKKSTLILGVRTKELIPQLNLDPLVQLEICTDDGSQGFHGTTIDRLKTLVNQDSGLYGCGPAGMLKAMSQLNNFNHEVWVSMEEYMACAVGACMGCVVDLQSGEKARVCVEGPIMEGKTIKWT
ncbi:dihydroorotate dehydrogenase electron transfer subunit [Spirochaeta cellobiosiphila]|uniref:dihydroorotate dehydrogenase electron transfer subunit n=1 Tax=Spirochaeta cellobiosiphila TaxID=504483 RepID=UPI00041E1A4D|nr:dihydroorotate dehydrogenase electron transfer subunit [Spirochaeta cellobiosiphila]